MAACSLAAQTREEQYLEEAKRWKREDLELFSQALGELVVEMEKKPFTDLLGVAWMDEDTWGKRHNGEYYTPQPVADLLVRMTLTGIEELFEKQAIVTLCEPACGSGTMILAAAHMLQPYLRRTRFTAIDLSAVACDMVFINTTLWGIPCRILHGNALSMRYHHEYRNFFWPRDPDFVQGAEPPVPIREQMLRNIIDRGQSPKVDWKRLEALKAKYAKAA